MKLYQNAKRFCLAFFLVNVLLLCGQFSFGQTAGFTANGQAIVEGDTLRICRGSNVNYLSTAVGFTTINWQFHLGTPATSNVVTPPSIGYNTNGIDSTIQIVSNGITNDTFLLASESWAQKGIPENPKARLYAVAKNKTREGIPNLKDVLLAMMLTNSNTTKRPTKPT